MMKRMKMLVAIGAMCVAGALTAHAGETYRLASAQVVTSTTSAPSLRLRASGPVAFRVVPAAEQGVPPAPGTLVAQLYGVYPTVDMAAEGLAPFTVTVTPTPDGALLTVSTTVSSGMRLELRAGDSSSELEVRQVAERP